MRDGESVYHVLHGKHARPYNDALSVVGKPSGLRSVSWDYDHYCGRRSATGQKYPSDCDGMIGSVAAADRVFGDSGPVYMMRLLMPSSSLSNMVEIICILQSSGELGTKWRLQKLYRTLSESLAHAPS
eukprot:COSAG03_NODE_6158_length_1104_cov_35.757214_1_plen_127_part_10